MQAETMNSHTDVEKHYMQSPLVLWVETFKANDGHPLEYRDLYDGVFLNDVMQQINHRQDYDGVNRCVEDVNVRLHNWDILIKNIKGYYRDVLQQMLVMVPPNASAICRDPDKDTSYTEIRKTLLLILGCAVQCEQKEAFIDRIMAMGIEAQTEIVENIKEVTDDNKAVLSTQIPQSAQALRSYVDKLFHHLQQLIQERDQLAEMSYDLTQERDIYQTQAEGKPVLESPQMSPEKHHIALELAESKAKLRHLRQEMELYQEQLSDVRDELKESTTNVCQLKNENASLLHEARLTRSLKDEIDILKEKSSKVDMYEKEVMKYKERLNELEFYKARTEELKEDNSILEETKAMLEDQLTNSRKRIETVIEMETEVSRYRQQIEDINRDREIDREKLDYLAEENARLEFEKKSSMNESVSLESELSAVKSRIGGMGGSLSDQLSETSHARVLRLELENQRLSVKLAEMKDEAMIQNAEISLELEKENKRLSKKIEKLQTNACESSSQVVQLESDIVSVRDEKERLVKTLDAVKEHSDRQVMELERENEQLTQTLHSIRERSEKTNDMKVKDLERENRVLHETISTKNTQLNKLEFDTRQMQRSMIQLQENVERIQSLEEESRKLEKENTELHSKVSALQHCTEQLEIIEQENSEMVTECRKLQKTVESLQAVNSKREQLEEENISLKVDHQRLQRTLETLKTESDRAIELETEKDEMKKEVSQLQKSLEGQKTQKLKQEQMEFEIIDLGHENQKLQKSLDVTTRRLQQLEKDNNDLEMEGEKMAKELDNLRLTSKKLEEREKELSQLEAEMSGLQRDKSSMEKENRKLKQNAELKDSSLEELNAKFSSLDQESKSLRQSVEKMKEACSKVKELEKENKELLQELNTDRRTLATLREELVSEKIKAQECFNQMEQLKSELERVGINTEKLQMAEQVNESNRYKALEAMIEETLKKSNELKEEKIQALESRLDESKKRNAKQQEDLRAARSEVEVMKQRIEEDHDVMVKASTQAVMAAPPSRERVRDRLTTSANISQNHSNKEVEELKDRRIELERMNATLLAENKNLSNSNKALSKQNGEMEAHLNQLLAHNSSLQGNNVSLQERVAHLQVENTTLQSQSQSSVVQQNMLKEHITRLEADNEMLGHSQDSLKSTHDSLIRDHESLQKLHEQLTSDYEKLLRDHSSQKSLQKSLKSELRDLQEQLNHLLRNKDDVNKLRDGLEREKDQLQRELQVLGNLQTDYNRLKEDHEHMGQAYDKLSHDYSDVIASHKQVKTDYNNLQRKVTEQEGNISEAKENLSVADVEFQKLENKIDAMYQINERLENENQALLLQIQQLLNQNQDLLTQALNSKDHFAEEEKAYLEKLSELRRQKERLEEKIMDHYRNRISPKKKSLGALIARKAKGIISRAPRRSKSRNNLHEGQDNSSQGSFESPGDLARKQDGLESRSEITLLSSLTSCSCSGAKSTEDLNDGFTKDSNLLPGIGKPYTFEDGDNNRSMSPGFGGRKTPGRSSPGSEMLTLDQFLKEANTKTHRNGNEEDDITSRRRSNDSGSRGSDNSNNSNNRLHHHHQQLHQSNNSHSNVPDVAASSFMSTPSSARDRSASRASRLSTGSGHDTSSLGSSSALANIGDHFTTSTPKTDQDNSVIIRQHQPHNNSSFSLASRLSVDHSGDIMNSSRYLSHKKRLSGSGAEDWRSSSQESSPYTSLNRVNASNSNHQLSSSSPRGSRTSSNNSLNQHLPHSHSSTLANHSSHSFSNHLSHSNLNNNNNDNSNHEDNNSNNSFSQPPPLPSEPPPHSMSATERLDRLTFGKTSSVDATNNISNNTVHYDKPTPSVRNNVDRYNSLIGVDNHTKIPPDPPDRRKSLGAVDRLKSIPNQFQPPIPRSQPNSQVGRQGQGVDNSVVGGHNPGRPPVPTVSSQNQPQTRTRPASVMGPSARHIRGVISRPPGGERRQQPQGQGGTGDDIVRRNNQLNNEANQGQPRNVVERPKSVPPHLFNKPDDSLTGGPQQSARGGSSVIRRDMPVPLPRRNSGREMRDELDHKREDPDGREPASESNTAIQRGPTPVTLIREPSRRGSRSQDISSQSPRPSSTIPSQSQVQSHHSSNTLSNSRQSSSSSLSSQTQLNIPATSANLRQSRPDTLPLRGSNIPPSHTPQHHPTHQQVHQSNSSSSLNRPPSSSSGMPRSQSSIGNPLSQSSNYQQQQQQPNLTRSITPGPNPARRNFPGGAPNHNNTYDSRDRPDDSRPMQESALLSNHGQFNSNRDNYLHHPSSFHSQSYDNRTLRGGSEPRDIISTSARSNSSLHSQPLPPPLSSSSSHTSTNHSIPSSRSHSQGPPMNRSHSAQNAASMNGPLSPQSSSPSYYNQPPPPPHSSFSQYPHNSTNATGVGNTPQIRSQGKSSSVQSNFQPESNLHSNSNVRQTSTVMRSPGEVMGHDKNSMGLPSSLPDAGPLPNHVKPNLQQQNPSEQHESGDGEAEAPPAKSKNSIWYEYGCV